MKIVEITRRPPRHVLRERVVNRAIAAPGLEISLRGVAYSCEVSEAEALDLLLEERSDYGQKQYEEGFREGLRQARFGVLARATGRAA